MSSKGPSDVAAKVSKAEQLGDALPEGMPAIMALPRAQQLKILETERKLAALDLTWRCWVYDQTPAQPDSPQLDPFTLNVPKSISVIGVKKLIQKRIDAQILAQTSAKSGAASKTSPITSPKEDARPQKSDLTQMNLVYEGIRLDHDAGFAKYVEKGINKSKVSKKKAKVHGAAFGWSKPYVGSIWIVPKLVQPSNGALGRSSYDRSNGSSSSPSSKLRQRSKPKRTLSDADGEQKRATRPGMLQKLKSAAVAVGVAKVDFKARYAKLVKQQEEFNKTRNSAALEKFGHVVSKADSEKAKREEDEKLHAQKMSRMEKTNKKNRDKMNGREYRSSRARVTRDRR